MVFPNPTGLVHNLSHGSGAWVGAIAAIVLAQNA